jgi:hypothetical protein
MKLLLTTLFCAFSLIPAPAAIWEFDLGGLAGSGLLGGNVIDNRADSFAWGKEVGHNEIPGILYDDVSNTLEFHVGWGSHEVINGIQLAGQYVTSALYGPAAIDENAAQALYSFDTSNGYVPTINDPTGRTGFIHARVQLVDLAGYSVAQQEADLLGSRFYFSIISTAYETGEIRGQLLAVVPEPQHYALLTGALLLATAFVRRKMKISTANP